MEQEVKYNEIVEVREDDIQDSAIVQLKPLYQRFVHMWIAGTYKIPQIAEVLRVSEHTVRSWLKRPDIKSVIEQYQREEEDIVHQNLKALRLKALNKMNDLMDSEIDGIAYQAARDILDRTGFKPSQKQDVKIEVYNYEQQMKEIIGNDTRFIETKYEIEDED